MPSCDHKNFYVAVIFSFFLYSFIAHFFRGLAGAFVNPRSFFKFSFYTFTCWSNNSLISSWISAKFVSALLLCMLYLSYYYAKQKHLGCKKSARPIRSSITNRYVRPKTLISVEAKKWLIKNLFTT